MFSLIITIVGLALVVALVAATMYHGGDTVTKGSQTAAAARMVNEGEQLHGAFTVYTATTGDTANSIQQLVDSNVLRSVPTGWESADGYAYHPVADQDTCLAANEKVGVNTVPTCSDPAYATTAVCCTQ